MTPFAERKMREVPGIAPKMALCARGAKEVAKKI